MKPGVKAAVLWGIIGALLFLVLVQAFRLTTGRVIPTSVALGVAVGVGAVTALGSYLLDQYLG